MITFGDVSKAITLRDGPRMKGQHCWELLHPFAHHCQHRHNNSQHCWPSNVGSCCLFARSLRFTAFSFKSDQRIFLNLSLLYRTKYNCILLGKTLRLTCTIFFPWDLLLTCSFALVVSNKGDN